jgi:hypothetical protein
MTLTDFLLARIAEDEVDVERGMMRVSGPGSPARVRADCEAKRQIVELHGAKRVRRAAETLSGEPEFIEDCRICGHFPAQYPCVTLRMLALPFADHPDYREEWKP